MEDMDWKNSSARSKFEKALETHKERKKHQTFCDKLKWFLGIVLLQFLTIATLYGGCAYTIREMAKEEKNFQEQKMRNDWIALNKEVKIL